MGWIGLSLLCVVIVLAKVHYNHRLPLKEWLGADDYAVGAIVTFIIAMMLIGIFGGVYSGAIEGKVTDGDYSDCKESVNSWEIVSTFRETRTGSSFILGTGGSTTVDRYYVYRKDEPGLMFTTYSANRTYVVEQTGTPTYQRIDYVCPKPVYDFLWWSSDNTRRNYGKYGTLYVPEGTILREYKL